MGRIVGQGGSAGGIGGVRAGDPKVVASKQNLAKARAIKGFYQRNPQLRPPKAGSGTK